MAFIQTRTADIGVLFIGTFQELFAIKREIAIYFAAFFAAGMLAELVPILLAPVVIATSAGYFVGQYYLYRAALGSLGGGVDPRFKVFSFTFMAVILAFPILFGLNIFYIPGLLLAAKWVMAPAFLVGEEGDLFQAMGNAWSASSNNLVSLSVVFAILVVCWTIGIGFLMAIGVVALQNLTFTQSGGSMTFIWLMLHTLPVLLLGLSVTAYKQLNNTIEDVTAVFE